MASVLLRSETVDENVTCPPSVPVPPAGVLRVSDITHSSMKLRWDAAPGEVRKYIVTYKPEEGDIKEVKLAGTDV